MWFSPSRRNLSSSTEWSGSRMVIESGSMKAEIASLKERPCFLRFASSLAGSHSNVVPMCRVYTMGSCAGAQRHKVSGRASGPLDRMVGRLSAMPVARPPLIIVRHRDDFDDVLTELAIDDAEREPPKDIASGSRLETRPETRSLLDQGKTSLELPQEGLTSLEASYEIPGQCIFNLPTRRGDESKFRAAHPASREGGREPLPRGRSRPQPRPMRPLGQRLPLAKLPRRSSQVAAPGFRGADLQSPNAPLAAEQGHPSGELLRGVPWPSP